jgi:hypothetical protein
MASTTPAKTTDARLALRRRAIESGPLEIVGAVLDVRPKLLVDVFVYSRTGEDVHVSSASAASAAPMAVASRCQFFVSSRSRLRPAVVSS